MWSSPSDSSRSNSASWSLTSLGRADRSTPWSAIVGSGAAGGTFAIPRTAAATVQRDSLTNRSGCRGGGVYSISATPRHRHDCGRWEQLARGVCQSRDPGWTAGCSRLYSLCCCVLQLGGGTADPSHLAPSLQVGSNPGVCVIHNH